MFNQSFLIAFQWMAQTSIFKNTSAKHNCMVKLTNNESFKCQWHDFS